MSDEVWHTVGIVNDESMIQPHVLQQKWYVHGEVAKPRDRHRIVPVTALDGVEE